MRVTTQSREKVGPPTAIPQSPVANNIFRPTAFVAAHPNLFDRGQERRDNWLRYRDQNGLTKYGAVFSRGKLLFIDAEKFIAWLKSESEEG